MSHVDEGALHAYLDGALDEYPPAEAERIRSHLDRCGECADRLEEERRIRSDAHALLGLAAPEVELPSFEELRAYVQRTRRERKGISRLQRMGWAASVVIAVAAGWMLREGQLQTTPMDIGEPPALAPAAGIAPDAEVVDADDPRRTTAQREAAGSAAFDRGQPVATGGAGGAAGEAPAASLAALREDASTVGSRAANESFADADVSRRAEPDPTPAEAEPVAPDATASATTPAPTEERTVAAATETVDITPSVPGEPSAVTTASLDDTAFRREAAVDTGARAAESIEDAQARRRVLTSQLSASPPAEASPAGRSAVEAMAAEEEAVATEPRLAVSGYEVVDVVNLGEGTTPWGVRVRQRIEGRGTFEVFRLEPGIDRSILPEPEPGVGEAGTETPFGWVVVRGALSQDELDELLGRLLPEGS